MKPWKIPLILILAAGLTLGAPGWGRAGGSEYDWSPKKNEDGVQIRVRKVKGSDYHQFGGTVVLNVPLSELLRLYEEQEDGRMPEWFYGCKSVRLVETRSPDEKVFYMVLSMPAPMRDRDLVYLRTRRTDPESGRVEYHIRALEDFWPKTARKVRMPSIEVTWRLTPEPDGKTRVDYEQHCDVGSILPAWIVNAMADEVPFKTLTGLRRLLDSQSQKVSAPLAAGRK